jgi:hypothetical protein
LPATIVSPIPTEPKKILAPPLGGEKLAKFEENSGYELSSEEESLSQGALQPLSEVPEADSQASEALRHLPSRAQGLTRTKDG